MLHLGGIASNHDEGKEKALSMIENGKAWEKFRSLVSAQGGDVSFVDSPDKLPKAKFTETIRSQQASYLAMINASVIGNTAVQLGAGRSKKGEPIDHAVGIEIHHKVGDLIERGDNLFTIHANDKSSLEKAKQRILAAHQFSDDLVKPLPLFYGVIN